MKALLLLPLVLGFSSCASWQSFSRHYDRTYSVTYQQRDGSQVSASLTLHPLYEK